MAITNGYCDLGVFQAELGVDDSFDNDRLERVIETVSRTIDEYCGQFFYDTGVSDQTRYYTAHRTRRGIVVSTDPVQTVTTLSVATTDGGSYSSRDSGTWVLEPRNNPSESPARPYESVRFPRVTFQLVPDGVEIVGRFGWAAIPRQITEACLIQSARIQKRKDAPFGIADIPSLEGGGMRLSARLDPDVELLLKPFRRVANLGMVL